MAPVFRDGDQILVSPSIEPRRGDRVVSKPTLASVMAKALACVTAQTIELSSLNGDDEDRVLDQGKVAWIARIHWASQ